MYVMKQDCYIMLASWYDLLKDYPLTEIYVCKYNYTIDESLCILSTF